MPEAGAVAESAAGDSGQEGSPDESTPDTAWPRRLWWVLVVLIVVAGLSAAGLSLLSGWRPVGDDAVVVGVARNVPGIGWPLSGMPNSLWQFTGTMSDHPGPMIFYWFAPWTRVFGRTAGAALGATLINLASIAVCGWAARRISGDRLGVGYLFAGSLVAVLTIQSGLVRPLNSMLAVLPMFAALVLAWAVLRHVRGAVPALIVAATFAAQAHLSYAVISLTVALFALVWEYRRCQLWRTTVGKWSLALVAALWSPLLVDAVLHGGGNVGLLVDAVSSPDTVPSRGVAAVGRFLLGVVTFPLGFRDAGTVFEGDLGVGLVVVGVAAFGVVGRLVWWALMRGPRFLRGGLAAGALALAGGAATAWLLPATPVEELQTLWFVAVAVFVWSLVATCAVLWLSRERALTWATNAATWVVVCAFVPVLGTLAWPTSSDSAQSPEVLLRDVVVDAVAALETELDPQQRYLVIANRSVDADRALQPLISDRVTAEEPLAIDATSYWGDQFAVRGEEIDGVVVVTDRPARGLPSLIARPGPDPGRRSDVADELAQLVLSRNELELNEAGRSQLAEALDGRLSSQCETVGRYLDDPVAIATDAPDALVQIFAEGWVTDPRLPPALADELYSLPREGVWVYLLAADGVDLDRRLPEHLLLSDVGCHR